MIVLAAFGFIHILNQKHHYHHNSGLTMERIKNLHIVILAILIVISYYAGRIEIETYWDQLYIDSVIRLTNGDENTSNVLYDNDIKKFKSLWIINYSLLFVSILMHIYLKKIKHSIIGHIIVGCVALSICIFLIIGLYNLSELRASYLYATSEPYYSVDSFNVLMRYISLLFVALALYSLYKYIKEEQNTQRYLRKGFDLFLHITIVWIVSSELIQWMDIFRSDQSYKFGLSILWGSYALLLIAYGIWKKHKHLRIAAIGLFALTLIKLFTYDISYLNNIAKTILFVSLGILLLIISFLYNKYKHLITENESTVDETSVVKDPDVEKT